MSSFARLLLALDLGSESDALVNRVQQMYPGELTHLHVVHVIRHGLHAVTSCATACSVEASTQRLLDHARTQVNDLLSRHSLQIPAVNIHLLLGEPAFEIKRLADELQADLVIVGSHSKADAWLQLPGATTNCVIQGINSDVMAVKV